MRLPRPASGRNAGEFLKRPDKTGERWETVFLRHGLHGKVGLLQFDAGHGKPALLQVLVRTAPQAPPERLREIGGTHAARAGQPGNGDFGVSMALDHLQCRREPPDVVGRR